MMEEKKISAEEARALQRQKRLERYRNRAEETDNKLVAPTVKEALVQPGNLASQSILRNGFTIRIPEWGRVIPGDMVSVYINSALVETNPVYTVPPGVFNIVEPIEYTIKAYYLGGYRGAVKVQYVVRPPSNPEMASVSENLYVNIDREPPGGGTSLEPLKFPAEMNNTVTRKYLTENQNRVIATVPGYPNMEVGQEVSLWWNGVKTSAVSRVVVSAEDVLNHSVSITIGGDQFLALADDRVMLQYNLTNRIGIEGFPSQSAYLKMQLEPGPENLPDPVVPFAADGLIDLEDANHGVEIEVGSYTNAKNGDIVAAYWGGIPVETEAVTANNFPVTLSVPRSVVLTAGSGSIPVYYEVLRGGVSTKSNTIQIEVDVATVGPVDPDLITPVNEALQPPLIIGGSGLNPNNALGIKDRGKNATATIPFFQSARGKPSDPIVAVAGAEINLMWGEQPSTVIGPVTVTQAHIDAQMLPSINIPAAIVDATPDSSAYKVYYTLSRGGGNPVKNPVMSPAASVLVEMNVPGGPDGLRAPKIQGINAYGWLLKKDLKLAGGLGVRVEPYSGMKVNDQVELRWVSYSSLDHAVGTDIIGTEYSHTIQVTAVDLTNGLNFLVPYSSSLEPIFTSNSSKIGSGGATYIVTQNGKPYESQTAFVLIDMSTPEGN